MEETNSTKPGRKNFRSFPILIRNVQCENVKNYICDKFVVTDSVGSKRRSILCGCTNKY